MDPDLLREILDSRLSNLETISLGQVVSSDGDTADVQPLVKRKVATVEGGTFFEDRPVQKAVPVLILGTARSHADFGDLAAGDLVLLFYCKESPAEGWDNEAVSIPADQALHAQSNSFCLPVCKPSATKFLLGGSSALPVALAGLVDTAVNGILAAMTGANAGGVPITWGSPPPSMLSSGAVTVNAV